MAGLHALGKQQYNNSGHTMAKPLASDPEGVWNCPPTEGLAQILGNAMARGINMSAGLNKNQHHNQNKKARSVSNAPIIGEGVRKASF